MHKVLGISDGSRAFASRSSGKHGTTIRPATICSLTASSCGRMSSMKPPLYETSIAARGEVERPRPGLELAPAKSARTS